MRVAFLSEGATELALARGARESEAWRHDFLVKILVERILGVEGRIEPFEDASLPFLLGSQAGKLCRQGARLVRACARLGAEAAVIVVDNDRRSPRQRWRALRQQRENLRSDRERPLGLPLAIGVAVETIEAWLLADEVTLCDVLRIPRPSEPMGSPENLDGEPGQPNHPKWVLNQYLSRDTRPGRGFLDQVAAIGRGMDLDAVARQCPEGFGRFRDDVVRELGACSW